MIPSQGDSLTVTKGWLGCKLSEMYLREIGGRKKLILTHFAYIATGKKSCLFCNSSLGGNE